MATSYSTIKQYGQYVQAIDYGLLAQVLTQKQQQFDQNYSQIQANIDNVANLDVIKQGDAEYVQDRLNSVVEKINEMGNLDLSNTRVAGALASGVSSVVDRKVINAVAGTKRYREEMAYIEKLREDDPEKYNLGNFAAYQEEFYNWYGDGKVGSAYKGANYLPYKDVNNELNQAYLKARQSMLTEEEMQEVSESDPNYFIYTKNKYVPEDALKLFALDHYNSNMEQIGIDAKYAVLPNLTADELHRHHLQESVNYDRKLEEMKRDVALMKKGSVSRLEAEGQMAIIEQLREQSNANLERIKLGIETGNLNFDAERTIFYRDAMVDNFVRRNRHPEITSYKELANTANGRLSQQNRDRNGSNNSRSNGGEEEDSSLPTISSTDIIEPDEASSGMVPTEEAKKKRVSLYGSITKDLKKIVEVPEESFLKNYDDEEFIAAFGISKEKMVEGINSGDEGVIKDLITKIVDGGHQFIGYQTDDPTAVPQEVQDLLEKAIEFRNYSNTFNDLYGEKLSAVRGAVDSTAASIWLEDKNGNPLEDESKFGKIHEEFELPFTMVDGKLVLSNSVKGGPSMQQLMGEGVKKSTKVYKADGSETGFTAEQVVDMFLASQASVYYLANTSMIGKNSKLGEAEAYINLVHSYTGVIDQLGYMEKTNNISGSIGITQVAKRAWGWLSSPFKAYDKFDKTKYTQSGLEGVIAQGIAVDETGMAKAMYDLNYEYLTQSTTDAFFSDSAGVLSFLASRSTDFLSMGQRTRMLTPDGNVEMRALKDGVSVFTLRNTMVGDKDRNIIELNKRDYPKDFSGIETARTPEIETRFNQENFALLEVSPISELGVALPAATVKTDLSGVLSNKLQIDKEGFESKIDTDSRIPMFLGKDGNSVDLYVPLKESGTKVQRQVVNIGIEEISQAIDDDTLRKVIAGGPIPEYLRGGAGTQDILVSRLAFSDNLDENRAQRGIYSTETTQNTMRDILTESVEQSLYGDYIVESDLKKIIDEEIDAIVSTPLRFVINQEYMGGEPGSPNSYKYSTKVYLGDGEGADLIFQDVYLDKAVPEDKYNLVMNIQNNFSDYDAMVDGKLTTSIHNYALNKSRSSIKQYEKNRETN